MRAGMASVAASLASRVHSEQGTFTLEPAGRRTSATRAVAAGAPEGASVFSGGMDHLDRAAGGAHGLVCPARAACVHATARRGQRDNARYVQAASAGPYASLSAAPDTAPGATATPAAGSPTARLAAVLVSRQSFRTSVLWNLHDSVPAHVCARFLLSIFALNDPLERLIAALPPPDGASARAAALALAQ